MTHPRVHSIPVQDIYHGLTVQGLYGIWKWSSGCDSGLCPLSGALRCWFKKLCFFYQFQCLLVIWERNGPKRLHSTPPEVCELSMMLGGLSTLPMANWRRSFYWSTSGVLPLPLVDQWIHQIRDGHGTGAWDQTRTTCQVGILRTCRCRKRSAFCLSWV